MIGISVITLLIVLILTTPARASTADFVGHSFSETSFAVEVDLYPKPKDPLLITDLVDSSAEVDDDSADPNEDWQFLMAYMNQSGIETAYSALEKYEHDLTFRDLLKANVVTAIEAYDEFFNAGLRPALDETIFHINATAPFQQLVQHFTTPEFMGEQDTFVTNNFMALIAYSSSPNDRTMDFSDDLYLGYTFSFQELIYAINQNLEGKTPYRVGNFDYTPTFTETETGYKFGINYTNMLVLWQNIEAKPRGIDIFDNTNYINDAPGGVVFGQDLVAASVLDYLAFEYEFETDIIEGANTYVEGSITTHYYIGETNFLVVNEDTIPTGPFANNPFVAAPSYTFTVPTTLQNIDLSPYISLTIPVEVTVGLPDLAFYVGDDAKLRMNMANGFGLTVATATNTFGAEEITAGYNDNTGAASKDLSIYSGGNTYYFHRYEDKDTYKLLGLDDLWPEFDPTTDHEVIVHIIDKTQWGNWDTKDIGKGYFIVEFGMAYLFTDWVAKQLSLQLTSIADSVDDYLGDMLFFTATEFPDWHGGEIYHDPTYSAVAAMAAVDGESSEETSGPGEEPSDGVPGFEILFAILAILPLYALSRKRRQ